MRRLERRKGPLTSARAMMMTSAVALMAASTAVTAPALADEAAAKKWIDSEFQPSTLSKDDQALVKKFGREAQAEERDLWNKYEAAALEKAKAAGNEIIDIADKKPFQDAVKPVWDKYGPKYSATIKRVQDVS